MFAGSGFVLNENFLDLESRMDHMKNWTFQDLDIGLKMQSTKIIVVIFHQDFSKFKFEVYRSCQNRCRI